jgi:hypothetical protein
MAQGPERSLTPAELHEILAKLEEVMAEAERLRIQITKQMNAQRRHQQQKLTPSRPRRRKSPA